MKHVKERVLDALARRKERLSGVELAALCGATRSAVWKAVRELRREGTPIDADRTGYLLTAQSRICAADILHRLPELGQVCCLDESASTNDAARNMALAGAPDFSVVVADTQTSGRGRFRRAFFSPPGTGLYCSVVLRPTCGTEQIPLITTCAAVAVSEAIESLCQTRVGIKWVNDLWIGGKKICGILTEGGFDAESGELSWAVLGIGINVLHTDFPPELESVATTIEDATGRRVDRCDLLCAILRQLRIRLAQLPTGAFLSAYRSRSVLDGKRVTVSRGGDLYDATVVGIGEGGELCLDVNGESVTLRSGEIVSVHPTVESKQ